ncbi:HK97-gp10 family putative phage morphogenesis protein [Sutcliffiella halmapala]|uniref:HK97-gp10 family putative phage morphogenesis protein n=1 Tax=Sutcliffiella halmapala TaxID=79882 RepID=UPI0009958D03|nr:HK97-gp10 family putative phage morphogenesis protein [Sutcliffiella halmapala]
MSKNITVTFEGVGATIRAINMFDMQLKKDLIATVKETAQAVSKDAKARAPVSNKPKKVGKSGDLKRSIRPKYFEQGLSATVAPRRPKGAHRHLVEYGTVRRSNKKGANRGKMPSNPFMDPAEKSNESRYNQKVRSLVDRDRTI